MSPLIDLWQENTEKQCLYALLLKKKVLKICDSVIFIYQKV